MGTVAFLAARCVGITLAGKLPVGTARVLPSDLVVASGAIHPVRNGLARPHTRCVYLGVALAAGLFHMARVAQLAEVHVHGLPVARPPQLLVRVAVQAVRIGHALRVEDIADLVRLMAIHARGQDIYFLFPQRATNDLPVHRFDLRVAFRARRGYVSPRDRRSGIGVGQDQMRRMACRAVGRHRQPLL